MDSRRGPGEVVGSHSCICASCPCAEGVGWAAAASLAHYIASQAQAGLAGLRWLASFTNYLL